MPRSSRHKSSKHSSRDTRDYSDSEESVSRERRGGGGDGGGARVSKDSGFNEKRRVEVKDSKDAHGSGNGDYAEEHGLSKRRKEKFSDGVSDRWNGGDEEGSSRGKSLGESKSRRRDEESEDARRSGKSERHRESSRKEGRDSERKEREGKAEKMDEKQEIATDSRTAASESENITESQTRKRRESLDDGAKYFYDIEDAKDRHAYSGDDSVRGGKQKDEKLREERHRDKYREEVDKDSKNRYEKRKDDYPAKDRNGSRSSEKYLRDEKDNSETRPKRSKPHDSDWDADPSRDDCHRDRDRDRDRGREKDRDRDRDSDRDRDQDHDHDPDWDRDRDGDRDRDRDREWVQDRERVRPSVREKERDRDWERSKERDRDQERERDHDRERDYDDRSLRYKDNRGIKRSPEDHDDYHDSKLRDTKARRSDLENRSLSSTRVKADDRGRSQPRQGRLENIAGSNRSKTSPTSSSHGGIDEYRHEKEDDPKYRDSSKENRSRAISPRESAGFSGPADKGSKYTHTDKHNKLEDGYFGEFSAERSSGSKASPRGLTERSPSSTSLDRSRHTSQTGVRRNLDPEETGRRSASSIDGRAFPVTEGRLSREMSTGRHAVDESPQVDPSFNNKSGPSNSGSLMPPQPPRRNNDPNLGRGHGNNWRGVPSWPSPLPNNFNPFQHGPPHGNFPAMMPHFAAPPLFGVRPPIDINQSGLPYHVGDADGFPGHMRPMGWQNMMDVSGLPRFHGWEGGGGHLREDPHLYQGPEWDQSRRLMNIRGWETNSDPWKAQNGDLSADLPSASKKEEHPVQVPADDSDVKGHGSTNGSSHQPKMQAKSSGGRQEVPSSEREVIQSPPVKMDSDDLGPDSSKSTEVDTLAQLSRAYLSKLDISAELADPELYEQCLSLLGGEQVPAGNENPAVHIVLEGHGNAIEEIWDGSLRGSLFPAIDGSVLQKAMNHYKKQRLEEAWSSVPLVDLGPLDIDSLTNGHKVDDHDRVLDTENKDEMEGIDDKKIDSPRPTSDEMIMETQVASPPAEQKLEDCPEIASDKEAPHSADAPSENETEGPVDVILQLEGDHEALPEAQAVCGNTTVSSPLVNDGTCGEGVEEAMMPNESNSESEMADLSRIHQSPESTH